MLSDSHEHSPRVRDLLSAASEALRAQPSFQPVEEGPVHLDLVLHAGPQSGPWDATNYLGGIADVLEDKARRGQTGRSFHQYALCLHATSSLTAPAGHPSTQRRR